MAQQQTNNLTIRCITAKDLPAVAQIHMLAFPDSALTALGRLAVQRYYQWQLIGPHNCYPILALSQSHSVGLCFAGIFRGALSGFINHNWSFLLLLIVRRPWLLSNPLFRERLSLGWRTVQLAARRKRRAARAVPNLDPNAQPAPAPAFNILSVAVDPAYQGQGIGKMLIASVEQAAIEQGYQVLSLSVSKQNSQAIQFYAHSGWCKVQIDGKWRGHMIKVLDDPSTYRHKQAVKKCLQYEMVPLQMKYRDWC